MRSGLRLAASLVLVGATLVVSTSSQSAASGVANLWPFLVQADGPESFAVLIALEFDTPNPKARILELAERYEALVIHSVPDARTYSLQFRI